MGDTLDEWGSPLPWRLVSDRRRGDRGIGERPRVGGRSAAGGRVDANGPGRARAGRGTVATGARTAGAVAVAASLAVGGGGTELRFEPAQQPTVVGGAVLPHAATAGPPV